MNPHGFGLQESASGIRIPNADSRCGCGFGLSSVKISAEKPSSILFDKNVSFSKTFCRFPLKGQSSGNLVPFFDIYG
jgi:hypothetical protein